MEQEPSLTISEVASLLADIAEQVEDLIGEPGALSVFRHSGKALGRRLAQSHIGDEQRSREIVADFFKTKGFADTIVLDGSQATIHNCNIGLELGRRKRALGRHPLCYFGLGLVDGVNHEVTGKTEAAVHIASAPHADGMVCQETW